MKIVSVDAFQIFDSRGKPTVEAEVALEDGSVGRGLVPSGASTGQFEALELRDGDRGYLRGQSVRRAVENVRGEIAQAVVGADASDQSVLDRRLIELDGTPEKRRLGANAILSVSMAAANASAAASGMPLYRWLGGGKGNLLPLPEIQIFGGGAHAAWRTDIQDFLLIAVGAKSYAQTLEMTFDVYHAAGDIMKERGQYQGLADEGGYWPDVETNEEVFELFMAAIDRAGYEPGKEVAISLDIAASDLYDEEDGQYRFRLEDRVFSREAFSDLMIQWCERYPVISVEDPAADTDWESWGKIKAAIGSKVQLIGDDLFTTNVKRIQEGMEKEVANAVLIKLNQIGTVSETMEAIRLTQEAGWLPVVSARSGETEDAFISHLAVATNAGQLKVGSFARSERMAKWNEVLRIERSLGGEARFVGGRIFEALGR